MQDDNVRLKLRPSHLMLLIGAALVIFPIALPNQNMLLYVVRNTDAGVLSAVLLSKFFGINHGLLIAVGAMLIVTSIVALKSSENERDK